MGIWFTLCLICTTVQAELDFPNLTGRVVDQAGLLSTAESQALSDQLEAHEASTTNQIVVVTVNSLQGQSITDFTNQLARHWGIGQAGKDNGVVLLVAPEQRKVRIEVGYGLEGSVTDAASSDIIQRHILPRFRENDYSGGIKSGVENILQAVEGEYVVPERSKREDSPTIFYPLVFIAFIIGSELLRRFGMNVNPNAVFPAAFAGIAFSQIKQNLTLGIIAAVVLFLFIYLFNKTKYGKDKNRKMGAPVTYREQDRNNRSPGHQSSGGFSGGGGSFGGGGASGRW